MKCHYEVLNVARDADDGVIKSAYRKMALRYHPDKNLDDPDTAKEQFQFVQQAYEVLSDPQERAWYDKHRDEILKGKDTDYEEECLDVFQYFTSSCFKGYDPAEPKNFYAIYGDVFSQIFSEDFEYMSEKEIEEVPVFGDADADYETVVRVFYSYADSYSTKKSYAWLFPYSVGDNRQRKLSKMVDKENKKIQVKARKERNEEVRNLVAFVKKRDRRVQVYKKMMEEKAEQNRLKTQQERFEQIRRRNQELDEEQKRLGNALNGDYEDQLEQLESAYSDLYADDDESEVDEDEFDEELFCDACNKLFKDVGSFKNHQSTKKHRMNEMLFSVQVEEVEEDEESETAENKEEEELGEEEEEEEEIKVVKEKKKSKGKKQQVVTVEEELEVLKLASDDGEGDWDDKKSKGKKAKGKKGKSVKTETVKSEETPSEKPQEKEKKNKKKEKKSKEEEKEAVDTELTCATCNNSFPSKNKLFDHLKKTNHSIYLPKGKRNG